MTLGVVEVTAVYMTFDDDVVDDDDDNDFFVIITAHL